METAHSTTYLRVKDKEVCDMIQIKHRSTGKVIKEVDATLLTKSAVNTLALAMGI
jgi:hypothetical protein